MLTEHPRRRLAASVWIVALTLILTPAASHAQTTAGFACSASAVSLKVLDGTVQEPIAAGTEGPPCAPSSSGLQDLGAALSSNGGLTAKTAYAVVDSADHPRARAASGVEGLDTRLLGLPLTINGARSLATARCSGGVSTVNTSSRVARITLGNTPIVVDGVVQPVTDKLSDALDGILTVRLNETVRSDGGGGTVRAADITVLRQDNSLVRLVVAESRIDALGAACDAPTGDTPVPTGTCPQGSTLLVRTGDCVIPVAGTTSTTNPTGDLHGAGAVNIGPPGQAPSGGTVMSLATARRAFPASPCVKGAGPAYVVVGTSGSDKITGTNHADRMLGIAGADQLDGGRGDDCVDGGNGKDAMTGGQGNDRVYGGAKRDLVNGDAGNDQLSGGGGNDTLNAAFGSDRVSGGAGNDKINVATAGRNATVQGGSGADRVRCNPREVSRIHGVERVFIARRAR